MFRRGDCVRYSEEFIREKFPDEVDRVVATTWRGYVVLQIGDAVRVVVNDRTDTKDFMYWQLLPSELA